MSFWSAIGGDAKKLFGWLGSSNGQAVVGLVEAGVETAFPAATGVVNIVNRWVSEAIKVEGIAAAAGMADGSGATKSAIALQSLTPEVLAFAKQYGLAAPTAATIQSINDDVVAIIKKLTGTVAAPAPVA